MSEGSTDRILAAVSFSNASLAALSAARRLAVKLGAALDVLHVWQLPDFPVDLVDTDGDYANLPHPRMARAYLGTAAAQILGAVEGMQEGPTVAKTLVVRGRPHREIARVARDGGHSLVFIGATPRRGWRRVLSRRVARGVIRCAPCPVVCVRASEPKRETTSDARQSASL